MGFILRSRCKQRKQGLKPLRDRAAMWELLRYFQFRFRANGGNDHCCTVCSPNLALCL